MIAAYIKKTWIFWLCVVWGIFIVVMYFTRWQVDAARCTEPVTGVIVDYESTPTSGGKYKYRIKVEYEVDGETYIHRETKRSVPQVGKSYKLMYDPDDPGVAMRPAQARLMWIVAAIGFGMIVVFGYLGINSGRKLRRRNKSE